MSYGRQQFQGQRPPSQPPNGSASIGPNGNRQGSDQWQAQPQGAGGLRRETWRPSTPAEDRQPQGTGPGPSGYRSSRPLPPAYPPSQHQTQYQPHQSQPFSQQQQRQNYGQSSGYPPQNRYPDFVPPPASEPFRNERWQQPLLPPASRSPVRTQQLRDPQAFVHPSRRVGPPSQSSSSNWTPPTPRDDGPAYGRRHGKGKARDDSRSGKSRRSHDDTTRGRSQSRSRAPLPSQTRSRSKLLQNPNARSSSQSQSPSRSPSRSKPKRQPSASRSRSPKRARRRASPSRSLSRSPPRRKGRNKIRASPSYDLSPEITRRGESEWRRSRSRSASPVQRGNGEEKKESVARVEPTPRLEGRYSPSVARMDSEDAEPSSEVQPRYSPSVTRMDEDEPLTRPEPKSRAPVVRTDEHERSPQVQSSCSAPTPAAEMPAWTDVLSHLAVLAPVLADPSPARVPSPAPSAPPAPEPTPTPASALISFQLPKPSTLLTPAPPVRIVLKPAVNGRHAVHPSRLAVLTQDNDDAFERLARPPPAAAPRAPSPPPTPPPAPPPAPTPASASESARAELEAVQREWDVQLADVAPYLQSAFIDWETQGLPMSQVEDFLSHFLRRDPKNVELRIVRELHGHYMRYIEEKIRLEALMPASVFDEVAATVPEPLPAGSGAQHQPAGEEAASLSTVPSPKREPKPTPRTDTPSSSTAQASPREPSGSGPPPAASDETYQRLAQVGEGTYGKVYKARHVHTGVFVALKRIRMEGEKDGFPVTAMREIKLLQSLDHPNVIRLYEMMISKGSVYMVMQYMDHDLTGLLAQPNLKFTPAHLKSLNHQTLSALSYLHSRGILHRDMKGSNILLNALGELKLADFGLARLYEKRKRNDYTNRVITLWYRCPELLLGETVYGPEVDMWSAGCIMLELFTTRPIFQGTDEIHQLEVIYSICGTPSEEHWPRLKDLPWYELVKPKVSLPNRFRDSFAKWLTPAALDLAEGLLAYDPQRRLSADAALKMSYFLEEEPAMERPAKLLEGRGEHHELTAKQERARRRAKQ